MVLRCTTKEYGMVYHGYDEKGLKMLTSIILMRVDAFGQDKIMYYFIICI